MLLSKTDYKTCKKEVKEVIMTICYSKENINRETEITKREKQILDLKNTVSEMNNSVESSTIDLNLQKKESTNLDQSIESNLKII